MAIGMCRGPDTDVDLLISIFLKKLLLFGRHVTHSHCFSISFNQESRIASRNMDEIEVKVDIHSANASAGELRPAKRQGFEGAKSPEDQALITTALSPLKKPKAAASSSLSSPRAQPPACQVEKCEADLADAKDYYRRHRVCEQHSKARIVLVLGHQQRFCQQCSRFHVLEEFDEAKRSCRRRLAGHNERRRKTPSDSSVDRLESNNHVNDNWLRHMKESDKMTMVLERNTTAKVCKEIKNH